MMERNVRSLRVGLVAILVLALGLGFAYWLSNPSLISQRRTLTVHFDAPVAGLRIGAPVHFNGVRIGEVTSIRFDPSAPGRLTVASTIARNIPVKSDTQVTVEAQGLLGSSIIALYGGGTDAKLLADNESLSSNAAARPISEDARRVLSQIGDVISRNADGFANIVSNVDTFAAALGRNTHRIDGILAGLEKMTGGGSDKPATPVFDLPAPHDFEPTPEKPPFQFAVSEVTGSVVYDSQRLLMLSASEPRFVQLEGQWADSAPKLLQRKLFETFENAGLGDATGRALDSATAEYQLSLDLRAFQLDEASGKAVVEISARLISGGSKVVSAKVMRGEAEAASADPKDVAAGMARAFASVARQVVAFVAEAKPD